MPWISMLLWTTSVVVPAVPETMETCWPAKALISEDLPAFILPKKPMWVRFAEGVWFSVFSMGSCGLLSVKRSALQDFFIPESGG